METTQQDGIEAAWVIFTRYVVLIFPLLIWLRFTNDSILSTSVNCSLKSAVFISIDWTFSVKGLQTGKSYSFRVNAHTLTSQSSSEKLVFIVPKKIRGNAITAGVVGGLLFFIVAIILAVCTVKCVNKRNRRRRREQEKGALGTFFHSSLIVS